jgi:hypothetical protein
MSYEKINKVWSPRVYLLNILRENKIYSEFKKEWYINISENYWYFFSQQLLDNDFNFEESINWKTSKEFMDATWYSRPKINCNIELHWRVLYLDRGYYNIELFKEFLKTHIQKFVEKRWRRKKEIKK